MHHEYRIDEARLADYRARASSAAAVLASLIDERSELRLALARVRTMDAAHVDRTRNPQAEGPLIDLAGLLDESGGRALVGASMTTRAAEKVISERLRDLERRHDGAQKSWQHHARLANALNEHVAGRAAA